MATNNRTPTFLGDLRARRSVRRRSASSASGEICRRYGNETVRAAVDHMIEYAKRRFKAEVASWPDGV